MLFWEVTFNMQVEPHPAKHLSNLLMSDGCLNVIETPTRITHSPEILVDLIITNLQRQQATSGTIMCHSSDHLAIFRCIKRCKVEKGTDKFKISF